MNNKIKVYANYYRLAKNIVNDETQKINTSDRHGCFYHGSCWTVIGIQVSGGFGKPSALITLSKHKSAHPDYFTVLVKNGSVIAQRQNIEPFAYRV